MKRLVYRLIAGLLLLVVILLTWLTTTESGLLWAYQRALPYLPDELIMKQPAGKLIGPITIRDLEYPQNGVVIKAERLIVDWQPISLLTASVDISRLHIQSLHIVLPDKKTTEPPLKQNITLPDIHLPWRVLLEDAELKDFSISQGEQSYRLKQLRLDASSHFSQISLQQLTISDDNFSLTIKGDLRPSRNYRHDLQISWQTKLPSSAVIKGKGQLKGNMQTTRIKQQLQGPLELTLDAELQDLLGQLSWQAKVNASKFDLTQLDANWPALSGKLKLQAKGNLITASVTGNLDGRYPELGPLTAEIAFLETCR